MRLCRASSASDIRKRTQISPAIRRRADDRMRIRGQARHSRVRSFPVQEFHRAAGVPFGPFVFSCTIADASAMEQVFAESGLDWTIVRPRSSPTSLHREV